MHNLIHYFFFKLYSTKSYLKELNFDLFIKREKNYFQCKHYSIFHYIKLFYPLYSSHLHQLKIKFFIDQTIL